MPFPLSTFFACAFAKKRAARRGLQRPRQNAPPRTRFESAPWHPMPPHRPPFRRENRRFRSAGASLQPLPPPGGVSHAPGCAPSRPERHAPPFSPASPTGQGCDPPRRTPARIPAPGRPAGRWRRKEGVLRQKQKRRGPSSTPSFLSSARPASRAPRREQPEKAAPPCRSADVEIRVSPGRQGVGHLRAVAPGKIPRVPPRRVPRPPRRKSRTRPRGKPSRDFRSDSQSSSCRLPLADHPAALHSKRRSPSARSVRRR